MMVSLPNIFAARYREPPDIYHGVVTSSLVVVFIERTGYMAVAVVATRKNKSKSQERFTSKGCASSLGRSC
jgi:hypothetical protein